MILFENILLNNVGTATDVYTDSSASNATNGILKPSYDDFSQTYYSTGYTVNTNIGGNIYWDVSASNVSDIGSLIFYAHHNGTKQDNGNALGRVIGLSVQLLDASDNISIYSRNEKYKKCIVLMVQRLQTFH